MTSLNNYLRSLKGQWLNCNYVILGNEAADLDSMVAAVAYGYLLQFLHPKQVVLPLINIPRQEFVLRPEAIYLFALVGLGPEDLIFSDDVDREELFRHTRIVLVDHNKLSPSLEDFSEQVCAILDHHRDEGLYGNADPRIVQRAGSSCSLVTQEFIRQEVPVIPELATLLLGTVVLDTVNLDSKAGKACREDRLALKVLIPQSSHSPVDLFERLQSERFNVGMFKGRDLLLRDYKEYYQGKFHWGIAVIPLALNEMVSREADRGLPINSFVKDQSLDVLILMFFNNTVGFNRQLVVFWPDAGGQKQLCTALQNGGLDLCSIKEFDVEEFASQDIRCYEQGNSSLSRKAVQPLVANFLEAYA